MDLVSALISLISGGIGGNIFGAAWKEKSLGAIGNSIAGAIGGVAGAYISQAVGILDTLGLSNMTIGSMLGDAGSSAVGGIILTGIVGMIKSAMTKKA